MSTPSTLVFTVDNKMAGLRLDRALSLHPSIKSRSRASQLLASDLVLVDGEKQKPSYKACLGEVITVTLPIEESSELLPYDLEIKTYFEDDDLIVLEKPAGLVVHPAAGHPSDTLVNALVAQKKGLAMGFGEHRPGIVHRLDKDTSGVLVVAKNDDAHRNLVEQFRAKTVQRRYWAIVYGSLKLDAGRIESHLRRHPHDRKKFASERVEQGKPPQGKQAITHFRCLHRSQYGVNLVECRLETGRTHQIRIHMSEQHNPIVGDKIYGSTKWLQQIKNAELKSLIANLKHLALHAFEIGFEHPKSGQRIHFQSPWPDRLLPIVKAAGFDNIEK